VLMIVINVQNLSNGWCMLVGRILSVIIKKRDKMNK
jgi:hypothetical protein